MFNLLPHRKIFQPYFIILLVTACTSNDPLLNPSESPVKEPKSTSTFNSYISDTKKQILSVLTIKRTDRTEGFMGGYSIDEATKMRSPYEIKPNSNVDCSVEGKGTGKSFLLIHGLTDSPYLLLDVANQLHAEKNYPCALIRSILLPGHGTIAGDTLKMTAEQWIDATNFGIKSLTEHEDTKELYLVGFSTGTALITRFLHEANPQEKTKVKGAILLSAAMKANFSGAFLALPLSWISDWESELDERDAARFESFSYNAGAQFFKLTYPITTSKYATDTPLLMAVSADDTTIDPDAALALFCQSGNKNNKMVWYQSSLTKGNLRLPLDEKSNQVVKEQLPYPCNGTFITHDFGDTPFEGGGYDNMPKYQVMNMAHTALSVSPLNSHYGPGGKYKQCKKYFNKDKFNECINVTNEDLSESVVFGENNSADKIEADNKLFRRGTFNPFFDKLIDEIVLFSE